ncbi:MAG TPA: carboxymuconolactone decarboxylase family protein [Anaerovoracaceae bacterium]|nr:carboxymuconolactone decarboxylase family protein [Anaerovoracaceae bacterium]
MEYNKRIASVNEYFRYYFDSAYSAINMATRDKKILTQDFIERIMLAVTEVNGCKVCSQAHVKMALESGMTDEEISELLSNEKDQVPEDQSVAVMFATHYADKSGKPDKEITDILYDKYGKKLGKSIIAVCRIIMVGNVFGIAMDTIKTSNKLRELAIILGSVILVPVYLIVFILGLIFNR